MDKNFDNWGVEKIRINNLKSFPNFKTGDIWMCNIGINIGTEKDGKHAAGLRPVLIFSKVSLDSFYGVPLSKVNKNGKFYQQFNFTEGITSNALISQLRIFDARRLSYLMGHVSKDDFLLIKNKIKIILHL
jgi:mRNA-degrading endonuclease toxin of MazEF toxin-antitoxin module